VATREPFNYTAMQTRNNDTTSKLADCEMRMRRWHTRLTRASNALQKLERQRRRLMLQQHVGVGLPKTPKPKPTEPSTKPTAAATRPRAHARIAKLAEDLGPALKEAAEDAGIPAFLDRRDPLIAEAMTAKRKAAEADARRAMPLNERAALDAIRGKSKKPKA
jgi:hypothetical protein